MLNLIWVYTALDEPLEKRAKRVRGIHLVSELDFKLEN